MSKEPTRRDRANATRAKLIFVASKLFAQDGYETMSIAPLLAEAGVARGGFYHHFASKRELFAAVVTAAESVFHLVGEPQVRRLMGQEPWRQLHELSWFMVNWFVIDGRSRRVLLVDAPRILSYEERTAVGRLPLLRDAVELALGAVDGRAEWIDPISRQLLALQSESTLMLAEAADPARMRELLLATHGRWLDGLRGALVWEGGNEWSPPVPWRDTEEGV